MSDVKHFAYFLDGPSAGLCVPIETSEPDDVPDTLWFRGEYYVMATTHVTARGFHKYEHRPRIRD